ncbi:MAG: MBL fold metallo-hydrolase [Pseudomonadota bacterium]
MSRVTVVVDNQPGAAGLLHEWGLSLWIEHQGHNLLLDTGGGAALLPNLKALGLAPDLVEAVILSHGHWDHSGGLAELLKTIGPRPIWCHPAAFEMHLKREADGSYQDVGLPLGGRAAYEDLGAQFNLVTEHVEPWPGVHLIAPVPRITAFEGPAPNLFTQLGPSHLPDPLEDDLLVVLETPGGLVAITGCAHSGVVNLLLAVQDILGHSPAWLVGGLHLDLSTEIQQKGVLDHLGLLRELRLATGHCTGERASGMLTQIMQTRHVNLYTGLSLEL